MSQVMLHKFFLFQETLCSVFDTRCSMLDARCSVLDSQLQQVFHVIYFLFLISYSLFLIPYLIFLVFSGQPQRVALSFRDVMPFFLRRNALPSETQCLASLQYSFNI
jgi:hypothetical protein